MTACVNNEKKMKGGALPGKVARTFLAGALAATMVPSVAFAADVEQSGEASVLSSVAQNNWEAAELSWNVEADSTGAYQVSVGKDFYLKSATDVFGRPVSISDATVFFVAAPSDGKGLDFTGGTSNDLAVYDAEDARELPVGDYVAVVYKGAVDPAGATFEDLLTAAGKTAYQTAKLEVEAKSLEGSAAYEGVDVSDVSFKTLGNAIYVSFKDAEGRTLEMDNEGTIDSKPVADNGDTADLAKFDSTKDVVSKPTTAGVTISNTDDETKGSVKITGTNGDVAGDYKIVIRGANDYAGEWTTVSFTINPIDLSKDTVTVAPVKAKAGLIQTSSSNVIAQGDVDVYVNGELTADDTVKVTATEAVATDGTVLKVGDVSSSSKGDGTYDGSLKPAKGDGTAVPTAAYVTLKTEKGTNGSFVKDSNGDALTGTSSLKVVDDEATISYDGVELDSASNSLDGRVFVTSKGEAFDASLFRASAVEDGVKVTPKVDVTVTKDGKAVDSCTEPGVYRYTAVVEAPSDLAYAAYETGTFRVVGSRLSGEPQAYVQLDGKDTDLAYYDGKAVGLDLVVKASGKTLSESTDYKAVLTDAEGNVVDSAVEPGDYTLTVDYLDGSYLSPSGTYVDCENAEFEFTVDRAIVESAKAGQSVYAYTGEPVAPTFTAYTDLECKGMSVEVDPSKTAVDYYKAVVDPKTGKPATAEYNAAGEVAASASDKTVAFVGWEYDAANKLTASDIVEPGYYVAFVSAPAGDEHFQGTAIQAAQFEVSETAQYSDVDATEWYADSVYKAAELGYMTGVAGTKLFMPEAGIDREQIACVMFNMAGKSSQGGIYFPTAFSDVDGWAWYAEAVSWASQAGVMNGYAGTDRFGVAEKATREQVAAIFYNYAKSQGRDVSVKDVDGTLAKYADGDQVSPWMREAVAWAVENGVMGNGDMLWAQDQVTRAQVATMAVNFQPEKLK